MRSIWIAVAGILVAGILFAIYMHLTTVGSRDQSAAMVTREQNAREAEQPNPAAESGQPPSPVIEQPLEQPATADGNPQPTEGSLSVTPMRRQRPAAGQPLMTPPQSRTIPESSTAPTQETGVSRPENAPQSNSDVAAQHGSSATPAALQPPPPPVQPNVSTPPGLSPFAKLYVNGKVLVNGHLSTASYILAGDWVDTTEGSEATLVGDNFELLLRSGSRLTVDESGVQLSRGDVLVTTTGGTPVKTSTVSVTPRNTPNARYEVFDHQIDGVRVMTYQGAVLVQ
jgi:hypothetical protein